MLAYREKFKVNNIVYEFQVTESHEVLFVVVGGIDKNGKIISDRDVFGSEVSMTATNGITKDSRKVFSKVGKLFLNWVMSNRPNYFHYQCEERRIALYNRYALRITKHGYDYSYFDGKFYFCKKKAV